MKRILVITLILSILSCGDKKSDPQKIELTYKLEFDSFFATTEKFNFNPDKFWGLSPNDILYQKSVDACIGTDHKNKIFIVSSKIITNSGNWDNQHRITVKDTNNVTYYDNVSFPPFSPTDIVGTGNINNEFAISEISETPDIYLLSDIQKYDYNKGGKLIGLLDKWGSRINKLSNNPTYDLLFQYDSWDYLKDNFTHIGLIKDGVFSKIDLSLDNKISATTFDSKNNIWAIDYNTSKITIFDLSGKILKTLDNKYGLNNPFAICSNYKDLIFIGDTGNNRIVVLDENGNLITTYGEVGTESGQFNMPTDLCFLSNKLYVVDKKNNRIQKLKIVRN